MIRVAALRIPVGPNAEDLPGRVAARLGIAESRVRDVRVVRRSVDARRRGPTAFVLSVDADIRDEASVLSAHAGDPDVQPTPCVRYRFPVPGTARLSSPPVIVGTGPAGLFAGLLLARAGYRPVLIERGDPVEARVAAVERFWSTGTLDPDSNVAFGEGGAGTFSDGKLTTRIRDPRCALVLDELVLAGAPAPIAWSWKPHVGTDRLRDVLRSLRSTLLSLGASIRFRATVTDLVLDGGRVAGVVVDGDERVPAGAVVLATGHGARDTYAMLARRGVPLVPKPFAVGVRIEHLQEDVDRAQYRELAGDPRLGPASYQLAFPSPAGRGVYTFCMCPGGTVVAACTEPGHVVTNGMSVHARDGRNANSALVVTVGPPDFPDASPLAGVSFQRALERAAHDAGGGGHRTVAQSVGDFLRGRPSSSFATVQPTFPRGAVPGDVSPILPVPVAAALREALPWMDRRMAGFAHPDALLTAVETRTSSPVRIPRDDSGESAIPGLFPAGEGGGHAGGIVSAAVDGIRVAESIVSRWAPADRPGDAPA